MVFVRIAAEPADFDVLTADLWEAGTLGITEGDGYVDAYFKDAATASHFGEPQEAPQIDWVARTREYFPPLLVGERFFVAPPWCDDPTPEGRFRLEIMPGMMFGTGHHRTTQLCLEALERVVRSGDSVLDVGSGSGILSIAAKLLGAGRVIACDTDMESARPVPFFNGSVDAVRSGAFDIVVANISEAVRDEMREDLERVAAVRIYSGFQDENGEWSAIVDDSWHRL